MSITPIMRYPVRLLLVIVAAGSIHPIQTCRAEDPPAGVSPALGRRAVAILRQTMKEEDRWVKVHAAEFLLQLDYPATVKETFEAQRARFDEEPEYRIGIWRVLARAAVTDKDRSRWVDKIRAVFLDPRSDDRCHSAETLAKLGYQIDGPRELAAFRQAAADADGRLAACAAWSLANSGTEDGQLRLARLLRSAEATTRAMAAYAMRHLPQVSPQSRQAIAAALDDESAQTDAWIHVVSAAAVHLEGEDRNRPLRRLIELAQQGSPVQRYQACDVLAGIATEDDLPVLVSRLDDEDADVRSTAAYAVLRWERRGRHGLGGLDWGVILAYLAAMLGIGWYYARQTKTGDDYLLGGRNMKPVSVGLSLFATLLSTITYLSIPGEIIRYGPMILGVLAAFPLVYLIAGWLMIPLIMKLRITSAYELLETRLGLAVRMLGSTFFLAMRLLWMAVIIFATTDKVLVPLLELDPATTPYLSAVLALITVIYTSMGGLRAVVLTDVIQTLILFGGAILIIVLITIHFGGPGGWWPSYWVAHWPRPEFGFGSDTTTRVTFLSAALAQFTWWTCTAGSDQMAIQRYLATRDAGTARRVLLTSLLANTAVYLLLAAAGICLLAFFRESPQMLADGQTVLGDADSLLSRFIAVGLPAGVSGLVVAGLLAAAMSSLSSGVNSSCSVISVDFIDRFRRQAAGEPRTKAAKDQGGSLLLYRTVSVLVGIVVVLLSSLMGAVQGNLLMVAFKVVNLLTAPLFGLFFMAMFVRWATGLGTLVGAGLGLATVVAVNYWEEFTGTRGISFMWGMPLGLAVQIVSGSIVSLLPLGQPERR